MRDLVVRHVNKVYDFSIFYCCLQISPRLFKYICLLLGMGCQKKDFFFFNFFKILGGLGPPWSFNRYATEFKPMKGTSESLTNKQGNFNSLEAQWNHCPLIIFASTKELLKIYDRFIFRIQPSYYICFISSIFGETHDLSCFLREINVILKMKV